MLLNKHLCQLMSCDNILSWWWECICNVYSTSITTTIFTTALKVETSSKSQNERSCNLALGPVSYQWPVCNEELVHSALSGWTYLECTLHQPESQTEVQLMQVSTITCWVKSIPTDKLSSVFCFCQLWRALHLHIFSISCKFSVQINFVNTHTLTWPTTANDWPIVIAINENLLPWEQTHNKWSKETCNHLISCDACLHSQKNKQVSYPKLDKITMPNNLHQTFEINAHTSPNRWHWCLSKQLISSYMILLI